MAVDVDGRVVGREGGETVGDSRDWGG